MNKFHIVDLRQSRRRRVAKNPPVTYLHVVLAAAMLLICFATPKQTAWLIRDPILAVARLVESPRNGSIFIP